MANIKSSIKSAQKDQLRHARNLQVRSTVRGAVRQVRSSVAAGDTATAASNLRTANQLLDKAVTKGVLHRNTAARRKSRLAKLLAKEQAAKETKGS